MTHFHDFMWETYFWNLCFFYPEICKRHEVLNALCFFSHDFRKRYERGDSKHTINFKWPKEGPTSRFPMKVY